MNSGAAAMRRWFRAGRQYFCCSRTGRFICCARRSAPCCRGCRRQTKSSTAFGLRCSASKRCCSRSLSLSFCWPWPRSEPSKTAALIDPLTGIANRRALLQAGEGELKRQAANPRPLAVMLLDLDNFKSINDRFGHAVGDRVLKIFAEVSSGCLRRIDLFRRLGGGEFAAVLRDTSRERALAVAEQIRLGFAEATLDVDGAPVVATVSIGIVVSYDAMF